MNASFPSAVLGRTMPYSIYLPADYDADPTVRFPTLYLLHGAGGSNQEWIAYGVVTAADRLIAAGTIAPLLIVFPQGDQEYWVDQVGGQRWGTYVAREVVPEIDARYRTRASPSGRAIGGLSMGAHGAMQLALNFPGIWTVVGAHSPSLRPEGDAPSFLGRGADFAARDPLALITAKPELARTYSWWIDSGDADPWVREAAAIHTELSSLGIANEWHSYPGDHSASYWSAHIPDYLAYYARALA
ncbi:MAG: hypothetical protein E6J13_10525 [Chloroflexi bacterium]|nr:MAG: hypothetical protein E6J13_10525 [Chloroflexota bacterium]